MPVRGYKKGISDKKVPMPHRFPLRLSDPLHKAMMAEAKARSITLADYARAVLTAHAKNERAALPHKNGLTKELVHQFARIGNNLNQLARQANAGYVGVTELEIRRVLDLVNAKAAQL